MLKAGDSKKELILIGKFSEVSNYLKECQRKYIYVQELIDALNIKN